jgi:hypothetical protein
MANYPILPRMGGHDLTDSGERRRRTDIAPPLDYATQELVSEFIESQRRTVPPLKSFLQKLRRLYNE